MKVLLAAALAVVFAVAVYVHGTAAVLWYPAAWLAVGALFLVLNKVIASKHSPSHSEHAQATEVSRRQDPVEDSDDQSSPVATAIKA